jgi:hypothetical protein
MLIFATFASIVIIAVISNWNEQLKSRTKAKHYLVGTFILLITFDILIPQAEALQKIQEKTISWGALTYHVPYRAGDEAQCPLIFGYGLRKKIGTTVLIKKTRLLGLCAIFTPPEKYVEPKFGDWRLIEP